MPVYAFTVFVLRIVSLLREYGELRVKSIDRKVNVMVYFLHIDRQVNTESNKLSRGQALLAKIKERFYYVAGNIYGEGHVRGRIA